MLTLKTGLKRVVLYYDRRSPAEEEEEEEGKPRWSRYVPSRHVRFGENTITIVQARLAIQPVLTVKPPPPNGLSRL